MSINKHSIIVLISFFFLITFILINFFFWIAVEYTQKRHESEQMRRFLLAERIMHHEDNTDLEHLMIRHSSMEASTLLKNGSVIIELPFAKMIRFNERTFFIHLPPPRPFFDANKSFLPVFPPPKPDFKDVRVLENTDEENWTSLWAVLGGIDLLMIAFYIYLIRKLLPLYRLKQSIRSFQEGDTELNVAINGNDETSEITREFNLVLKKIASMKEARTLFLRNVLHELKTPIMKASLTADCLEHDDNRERLKRIFDRMGYLLDEFSKMERFSSGAWHLNIQEYRFVDLLDHACDILLCDKKNIILKGEESQLIIKADFELFTIGLKNLLDNAIKYGKGKPIVMILNHTVEICNLGDPIPDANKDFSKPFNREYENSSSGLGLGLYLTYSILRRHGFDLQYHFHNEMNCFSIRL